MSKSPRNQPGAGGVRPAGPVFLERGTYRQRRLTDAVRLMPVVGLLLWAVPLLWTRGVTASSAALLYVFGIWIALVYGAALLSRGMRGVNWVGDDDEAGEDG